MASSSTNLNHPGLHKLEEVIVKPLSPYLSPNTSMSCTQIYLRAAMDLKTIGLRYFKIFGSQQDLEGAYATVISKWIAGVIPSQNVYINGDGDTSHNLFVIYNAVRANLLIAIDGKDEALNQVYDIALVDRTTLQGLFDLSRSRLVSEFHRLRNYKQAFRKFRAGDVRLSLADISKAKQLLSTVWRMASSIPWNGT